MRWAPGIHYSHTGNMNENECCWISHVLAEISTIQQLLFKSKVCWELSPLCDCISFLENADQTSALGGEISGTI